MNGKELSLDELFAAIGQGNEIPIQYANLNLDELFAEADRLGHKYQSSEEIENLNRVEMLENRND